MVSGSLLGLCFPLRLGLVGPGADDRGIINGILCVLTTGCRWMDMPIRYGSYKAAWRRLKRWQGEGV
ncbi:transposase, partial [Candidatus Bathyarchaeota archaeon]|nr:transposase [Candidatus Bathyarchaeota archaeon]